MTYLNSSFDPSSLIYALGRVTEEGTLDLLGTAFSVGKGMFCTAAHVTGGNDTNLVVVTGPKSSVLDYQLETSQIMNTVPVSVAGIDPIHDVCLIRTEAFGLPSLGYISTASAIRPGTNLVSFGYPHSDSGRIVLTRRDMTCAAKTLGSDEAMPNHQLVLNVFARPGESGAPVLDTDGNVVAMIKGAYAPGRGRISIGGIDPAALHATTHAVSAEYILEMLNDHI